MDQNLANDVAVTVSNVTCELTAIAVAMDTANQALPNGLPTCPDGSETSEVYYGCACGIRRLVQQLNELQDKF